MAEKITLTVDNGLVAGTEYVFGEPGTCVIGRAEDCDVRLPALPGYQDVSRHHCLLEVDPPRVRVRDLGSLNGTRLNGVQIGSPASATAPREGPPPVTPSYPLKDGDELQVDGTFFRVSGAVADDSTPAPPDAPRTPAPVQTRWARKLTLDATTAADLMTPGVVSIPDSVTLPEAVALLTEKDLGAVPVMGPDGRPVGVLSRTDVVDYDYKGYHDASPEPGAEAGPPRVRDIMTAVVFAVARETPAAVVVDAMLTLGVHRLYVTEPDGSVVGVITTTDVLRHLRQPSGPPAEGVA